MAWDATGHVVILGGQATLMEIGEEAGKRAPRVAGISDQRYWAGVVDLFVFPWVLGVGATVVVDSTGDAQAVGTLFALALLSVSEAVFGRTPGKAALGLTTRRADGGKLGWRDAVVRRSWMGLHGVGLIPGVPTLIGGLSFVAALLSVAVTTGRSADGRGWHDRLAGTEVVSTRARRRTR